MIDVLDTRAKLMLVSVFQGSERDLGELGISANIQFETGNASVDIGNGSGIGTTTTTQGRDNTGIWVRADLVQ